MRWLWGTFAGVPFPLLVMQLSVKFPLLPVRWFVGWLAMVENYIVNITI